MGAANSNPDYAGDLECSEAWELLKTDPKAQLVDVRTTAEWSFVGVPDLAELNRRVLTVEWRTYPSMEANPDFLDEVGELLAKKGVDRDTPILLLCRSGARSQAAAIALTEAGFTRAYNVAGGFEGDLNDELHRGKRNGWKAIGLPWCQS